MIENRKRGTMVEEILNDITKVEKASADRVAEAKRKAAEVIDKATRESGLVEKKVREESRAAEAGLLDEAAKRAEEEIKSLQTQAAVEVEAIRKKGEANRDTAVRLVMERILGGGK